MDIIDEVLQHPYYLRQLQVLQTYEQDRCFCRHDMAHFQEVARIAKVIAGQNSLSIPQEMITLAALFHDMGRVQEYEQTISHAEASAAFAREILFALDYPSTRIEEICQAILAHSRRQDAEVRYARAFQIRTLGELISYADQLSRKCYMCSAASDCKWPKEQRILQNYYPDDL